MRLRLTVRRHGLPETSIIWVVDSTTSPTIAQLLEQVNDSIPIEAGEWGFEDYAVEVRGSNGVNYECLHYQPVCKVMKEEDEVIIRPLLTQDLKVRKISGRHQISADGKHLVDGLAYGRPLLRKPADRPAIKIPPRKRRRITYSEEEEVDDDDAPEGVFAALKDVADSDSRDDNKQLVLHADFDDDDEEEDDDFAPGDDSAEEDNDSVEEMEDNDSEEELSSDDHNIDEVEARRLPESVSQIRDGSTSEVDGDPQLALADVSNEATRAQILRLQSAFPKAALAVCKYTLLGTGLDMGEAYEALNRGFIAVKPKSAITGPTGDVGENSLIETQTAAEQGPGPDLEDSEEGGVEGEEEDEGQDSMVGFYDQNGFPPGSIVSGKLTKFPAVSPTSSLSHPSPVRKNKTDTSNDDRALPQGLTATPLMDQVSSTDEDSDESSEDSTDEVSSSSDSDSSDSSEEEEEESIPAAEASSDSSSESNGDSSSDSSDEDGPEETSSKPTSAEVETHEAGQSYFLNPSGKQAISRQPRQGSAATRLRNDRRRKSQALARYKRRGVLPPNTTAHEFAQLHDLKPMSTAEEALAALNEVRATKGIANDSEPTANDKEFERRRQQLLAQLASGGVNVEDESSKPVPLSNASDTGYSTLPTTKSSLGPDSPSNGPRNHERSSAPEDTSLKHQSASENPSSQTPPAPSQSQPTSAESSQRGSSRRNKLDLGAGRRMLFGALGFKAPKTKTDEEKIRSEFSKFIRPENLPSEVKPTAELVLAEDDDSWQKKISYRAVECVQEGVVLSEPPFPFVQRWDPQQRNSGRRGKRKNLHQDQTQYHDNDSGALGRQGGNNSRYGYAEEQEFLDASYRPSYQDDSIVSNFEDENQELQLYGDDAQGSFSQQRGQSSLHNGASQELDDLPLLPEDLSSLDELEIGQAKVGMTIVFKQLDCSAATKWQPQMTDFLTAIVIAITDSGELQLSLAKGDRKQYDFDEVTGERLFDKFDMPVGGGLDEEDNGMLSLSFSELYEPKIIQDAPADLYANAIMEDDIEGVLDGALSNPRRPNRGIDPQEAQFSHVTETTLQSDAVQGSQQDEATQGIATKGVQQYVGEALEDDGQGQFHATPEQRPYTAAYPFAIDFSTSLGSSFPSLETGAKSNSVLPILQGTGADAEPSPEQISDETRRTISHMIKDAGFRSSIPSSILKDLQTNGTQSPGDDAVFEKLMKDTADTGSSAPYSPKFNGLGSSSPVRRYDAWDAVNASQVDRSVSPVPFQSSWVTIEDDTPSSSPKQPQTQQSEQSEEPDASGWMTESDEESSNSPARQPTKGNSRKHRQSNKAPIGKAQALWAQFQQQNGKELPNANNGKTLLLPEPVKAGTHESGATGDIEYPKLSVGSSITSQITDHGRQPDFSFDDSEVLNIDADIASEPGLQTSLVDTPILNAETSVAHQNSHSDGEDDPSFERQEMESETALPPQEMPTSARIEALLNSPSTRLPVTHRDSSPSSDESFPSLEEVFSQKSMKVERATPVTKSIPSNGDRKYQKAMAKVDEDSEGSDQSTPKQSQKHNYYPNKQAPESKVSASKFIKVRNSQPPASQASEPPQPSQASVVVDLTMSSDAEPQPSAEESDESEVFRAFRRYDQDDGDDGMKGGWTRKKSGSLAVIEEKRKTVNGLRASSQTSLASNKRRKILPRS